MDADKGPDDVTVNGADGEYTPSGELQGDTRSMPDRGTSSGVSDTYGADLGQDATNREGSIKSTSQSDGMNFA
jgi:hypothetical protein